MERLTGRILDFGVDSNGLPGADWIEEDGSSCHLTKTDDGNVQYNLWLKKGNPLPVEDGFYDMINARWSLSHNPLGQWPFILGELARVTKQGGVITILDSLTQDEDDYTTFEALKEVVLSAFTDNWNVIVSKVSEDEEELGFMVYAFTER